VVLSLVCAIKNAFSFDKLPNIHFCEYFRQVSHNLRMINSHTNISGEKAGKLDTLAKLFQAMRSRPKLKTTIGQLTKVRTPRRLTKIEQMNYKICHSKYSFALAHSEVRTKP